MLDAAHIISDGEIGFGQPVVPNGIPLYKIHHAAFDKHLIGIDADYRLHVSYRLLHQKDGPILGALKSLSGSKSRLPPRAKDCADKNRLEQRFEQLKWRPSVRL